MRLKEIQTKTPQQLRIDALKRSADNAKDTYKNEKKRLQIQQTQQRLQKLKSVGALGS
jgi:septum formation inhibitor MinC